MTTKDIQPRANGLLVHRQQLQLDRRRLIDGIKQLGLDGSRNSTKPYAYYHMDKFHTHERVMKAALHNLREAHAENCIPMKNPVRVAHGPGTAAEIYERYNEVRKTINDGKPVTIVKNGKSPVVTCEVVLGNVPRDEWATYDQKRRDEIEASWVDYAKQLVPIEDALISVIIQYDEQNVHAQALFLPVVWSNTAYAQAGRQAEARGEDREVAMPYSWQLNAKAYDGETKVASRVVRQAHFAAYMAPLGFVRGESYAKTGAKQLPNKEYRERVEGLCRELERVILQSEEIDRNTGAELKRLEKDLAAALGDQTEAVRQLWGNAQAEIAKEAEAEKKKARTEEAAKVRAENEALRQRIIAEAKAEGLAAARTQARSELDTERSALAADRSTFATEKAQFETDKAQLATERAEMDKQRTRNINRAKDLDAMVQVAEKAGVKFDFTKGQVQLLKVARETKVVAPVQQAPTADKPVEAIAKPIPQRPVARPAPKAAAPTKTLAEQKRESEQRKERDNQWGYDPARGY